MVKRKYIDPIPLDEWIRRPGKDFSKASAIWKAAIDSFKIVEEGLAWQVGNGEKCKIGIDPWVGCNEAYALSRGIMDSLHAKGVVFINQISKIGTTTIWHQGWKLAEDMQIEPQWWHEWHNYLQELHHINVRIKGCPNTL